MANPPPPYDDITGISRTVMKDNAQTSIVNYNSNARPGELVVNLEVGPPSVFVGNNAGQLSLIGSASGVTCGCFHKMAIVHSALLKLLLQKRLPLGLRHWWPAVPSIK